MTADSGIRPEPRSHLRYASTMTERAARAFEADEVGRVPLRYWWLKRLILAVGVYAALLAGLRWWVYARGVARFDTQVAALRSAGEPIAVDEFIAEPSPDGTNPAADL